MIKNVLKAAAVFGLVATFAGCASQGDLQSQVNQATRKAESAQQTANQALQTANEAKSMAEANKQRMERMFKTSMRK